MARRSLAKRVWYDGLRVICRLAALVLFRIRCYDRHWLPVEGGALLLSNHQSHLDPVLVGLACNRRLNYLARVSLFRFAPFRWLIQSLDAIPIDRDGLGIAGLKETLRRLKHEEIVLIFPEGTRTTDGEISPLKPGFCALARRGRVPLVPVAIEGAYQAWPRRRRFPLPARITIQFGRPILPEEFAEVDDRALVELVEERLRACHTGARVRRRGWRSD